MRRLVSAVVVVGVAASVVLTAVPVVAQGAPAGVPDREVVTPVSGDPALGDDIEKTYVQLHYPSPYSTMAHPEQCDWISYYRYRAKTGPAGTADADAVLTMQPGLYSGAANLDAQAPQVVRKAAAQGKFVEYIALDRRANCAEDRTGWDAAAKAGDYHVAGDYYFRGSTIDGKQYHYETPTDLSYIGEYGLALALDDWRAVIEHLLPTIW
ncbi:hypothetical protein [Antrihabitans stalactiti]|uniref:Secreted protein n=1 Tax=Antrihabitans stalactiti TaxID=2584121 RepID=A0A848K6W0_9NOCA|nr:hypothetical protein [Antrihabitans stalactiti]NMN94251.1 hypothetical protein [Antrihabitans stalactiti]